MCVTRTRERVPFNLTTITYYQCANSSSLPLLLQYIMILKVAIGFWLMHGSVAAMLWWSDEG
jgi:hypothetical protein